MLLPIMSSLCAFAFHIPSPAWNRNLGSTGRCASAMCTSLSDSELAQYLCKTTLAAEPGWKDGKGVTLTDLADKIEEWTDDEDDEFYDAVDALEEAGFLRVDDSSEDEDVLYSSTVIDGSPAKDDAPQGAAAASLGRLEELVKSTLAAQPRWADGAGVTLTDLSELIDEWEEDDDAVDEQFYDAIDTLEEMGWLRVENGEEDDMLYSAAAASTRGDAAGGGAPVVELVPPAADEGTASATAASATAAAASAAAAAAYDFDAEAAAAAAVLRAVEPLKRFGVDADDEQYVAALREACSALTILLDRCHALSRHAPSTPRLPAPPSPRAWCAPCLSPLKSGFARLSSAADWHLRFHPACTSSAL